MHVSAQDLSRDEAYTLLVSTVVPRPIAFITSLDREGLVNAAPFSYFNAVASHPPTIGVSIGDRGPGVPKDTLRNIQEQGEFTVNLVDEALAERMNQSATPFPPDVSEVEAVGLATEPGRLIDVPRLAEAPASLECKRFRIVDLEANSTLVIGRVLGFYVRDELFTDRGYIDPERYHAIGRFGGPFYTRTREIFTMERLTYEGWLEQNRRGSAEP